MASKKAIKKVKPSGIILPPFTIYIKSNVSDWLKVGEIDKGDDAVKLASNYIKPELAGISVRVTDHKGNIILEADHV